MMNGPISGLVRVVPRRGRGRTAAQPASVLRTGSAWIWPVVGVVTAAVAALLVARVLDADLLVAALDRARAQPARVVLALAAFAAAFCLRALAWRRVLPGLGFGHALSAIHLTLGANHVLPLRLGEPFRVLSATRRAGVATDAATASVVTLRAADMMAVVLIGVAVGPAAFFDLVGPAGLAVLGLVAVVAVVGWRWLASVAARTRSTPIRLPDGMTFGLTASAWLAESVLVWQAARFAGLSPSWSDAVLVTAVAVAAQVAAVAPGGFGTYEAAAVAAYVALGHPAEPALVAALGAHGLKTAYSLGAGAVAVFLPLPGLLGRFRLARPGPDPALALATPIDAGPVVLFMPAHNEERSVADCVARVPARVLGRPVVTIVIDDGSTDGTAARAIEAGAEVISLPFNRGLGAAVRLGLAEAVSRGAAAVAFCDADGEYPPEELATLVDPILAGRADYVTGSRFLGRIDHMHRHRRIGNLILTRLLSFVARRRISDGQTGYRAFSPAAAADAEVIHDFNYAQVITLDLLAKGYRHREVPISYRFRTEGESFIKLGPYLRHVVPAVHRELNG